MKPLRRIRFIAYKVRKVGLLRSIQAFLDIVATWRRHPVPDPFDERWGTDTGGKIRLDQLSIDSRNDIFGVRYDPTPPNVCLEALRLLPIRYEDFVFVDLGAGKGRVLLIASTFPFKRVVGVEFAKELVDTARRNLHLCKCDRAEVLCMDAAEYDFPSENLVVYLFNPFSHPLMERIFSRLFERMKSRQAIYVVYFNPLFSDVFRSRTEEIAHTDQVAVYRLLGGTAK